MLFLIFIPFMFVAAFLTNPDRTAVFRDPRALIPVFFLALLLFNPWLQRRAYRKRFRLESPNLTDITVNLDQADYFFSAPAQGEAPILWSAFSSYVETPNMVILIRAAAAQMLLKAGV